MYSRIKADQNSLTDGVIPSVVTGRSEARGEAGSLGVGVCEIRHVFRTSALVVAAIKLLEVVQDWLVACAAG